MKVDQINKPTTIVESVVQQQPAKEMSLINRLDPKPGQKVWEINIETREVKQAEFVKVNAVYSHHKNTPVRKRINAKDGHFYVSALNKKNALKHLDRAIQLYESQSQENGEV